MKKIYLLLSFLSLTLTLSAQKEMRLWQGGESTRISLSDAQTITYGNNGSTVTIAGTTYQTSAIDSIVIIPRVTVTYDGSSA